LSLIPLGPTSVTPIASTENSVYPTLNILGTKILGASLSIHNTLAVAVRGFQET
jgi:hypothetical protein